MRSLSLTGRIIAVVIATTVAFTGTAFAASWTASTSLSLNANDRSVDKGDKVTFAGNLSSSRKKCRSRQQVALFRGSQQVATQRTNRSGHYSFSQKIRRTRRWHTAYAGRTFGTHPDIKTCQGSTSNSVRVEAH